MAIPLQFTANATGTTLTLVVSSAANYGASVSNFDATLGFMASTATYVSTAGGTGYTALGNGATAGSVTLGGFASDGGNGQSPGSVLATITFTLTKAITDFPLTLMNVAFNNDAPMNGTADPAVACFMRGTSIATEAGAVAVEALAVGDRVRTVDGESSAVLWIGSRRIACGLHPAPHDVMPVRIQAGALADGVPSRDLLLSPDHSLFLGGVLIPVRYLLNGASIVQERWSEVTYYHVELERHAVLLAEGAAAESYLDTGNRSRFDDGVTTVVPLASYALSVWAERGCAPLVHEGPVLDDVRAGLMERATALGHGTVDSPDLHLIVDGAVLRGRRSGQTISFVLPPRARSVRLRSRRFVPAHMMKNSIDTRLLGVAVRKLVVDGVTFDPGSAPGWHAAEGGLRWTDGDAALPGAKGRVQVTLEPLGRYWVSQEIEAPAQVARAG